MAVYNNIVITYLAMSPCG